LTLDGSRARLGRRKRQSRRKRKKENEREKVNHTRAGTRMPRKVSALSRASGMLYIAARILVITKECNKL
jgi:hypothetical protein